VTQIRITKYGHKSLEFNGHRNSFLGVRRPGRDIEHLILSSAEVKNEWSYTSYPSTCLHGVDRNNFVFHTETKTGLRMPRTVLLKIRHSVHLLIFHYISVPHPSQSRSTLCNHQSTHLPLLLFFLPVCGSLMGVLLQYTFSPTMGKSECSYVLSVGKRRDIWRP
jgi:hypothetical protein